MTQSPASPRNSASARDAAVDRAIQALRGQRPAEAQRIAAEVLAAEPGHDLAAQVLGNAMLMLGRPGDAIAPLRAAAARNDSPTTEILLAKALSAAGQAEAALEQLRRTTARRPAAPMAFLEMGEQLGKAGRLEEAVAALESGLAPAPQAVVLRMGLGYLHLRRSDRAAARRQFEQARAAAPERHDALVALAKVLTLEGDYAAAAALHRQAVALRPDDVASRINLGRCLLETGDRAAGEEALRVAARKVPQAAGLAVTALAGASHGRLFLRPSQAAAFLGIKVL